MGARMPAWSYVGSKPMPKVARPIIISVVTSMDLRPSLSPKCPKTMPPSGRAKKPTVLVAKAAIVAASGSICVKKSFPNTSAEAVT